ncbi:hypothetical protein AArcSl_2934 [Halalkaliarchaeum desulfuricum]|uniref:Uncharacterized protein n=1 Tax=Halalkaliarchaeum desulfuricum TaxID=2055893 RepID=A0A343TN73_9EURY|nr:hypothetical protein [Halalkaliarchaeum desulfuricum]AUX10545.1 hypothetical protein AArcSl_2934 [Halalkaliarchaeum desulfuricum]
MTAPVAVNSAVTAGISLQETGPHQGTSPLDRYELDAPGCSAIRTLSSVSAEMFERVLTADGG